MKKDYYEVLGVSRDADEKKLKSAYRRLAKKYHPDANPGDKEAEQKFKEVGEAYAVLSDPEKKKLYDTYGFAAFDGSGGPNPYQNAGGAGSYYTGNGGGFQSFHFDGQDAEDLFRSVFGDLFGGGSGSTRTGKGKKSGGFRSFGGSGFFDGASGFGNADGFGGAFSGCSSSPYGGFEESLDLKTSLTVDFREAALGAEKVVSFSSPDNPGRNSRLKIKIPAGIESGKTMRLKGRGLSSNGRTGDLLIEVDIAPDSLYRREGLDIFTKVQIPFVTAALGGEATFPTLHGDVKCKIPAGTQSGSKIRLRGKGIIKTDGTAPGDEYVEIQILVPKTLNPEERRILEQFAAAGSTKKTGRRRVS